MVTAYATSAARANNKTESRECEQLNRRLDR